MMERRSVTVSLYTERCLVGGCVVLETVVVLLCRTLVVVLVTRASVP